MEGENVGTLRDKVIFITGASRGIGKAIALRAAQDGAKIIIAAKTAEPHPKLPGTIFTAAEEIREAGGDDSPGGFDPSPSWTCDGGQRFFHSFGAILVGRRHRPAAYRSDSPL